LCWPPGSWTWTTLARQSITNGFRVAGWSTADALGLRSDVKTVLAVAEDRGYQVGPVSQEWLESKPPDLVFTEQHL
jgi:LssY C-terminus